MANSLLLPPHVLASCYPIPPHPLPHQSFVSSHALMSNLYCSKHQQEWEDIRKTTQTSELHILNFNDCSATSNKYPLQGKAEPGAIVSFEKPFLNMSLEL